MGDKRIWLCHFSSSDVWDTCSEEFNSREEAIQFGMREAEAWKEEQFRIGTKEDLDGVVWFSAEGILEQIAQNAYDEAGEVAEYYLEDVKPEHLTELQESLNTLLRSWFDLYGYFPVFYKIGNVETIRVEYEEEV